MTTPKEEQKHTDLRECPFCLNGEGEIKRGYEHGSMLYFTRCVAHINPKHVIAAYGITQADADIAWNTRKADCHEELVAIAIRDYFRETVDQEHYADGDFAIKGDEWVSIGEQDINVAALAKDILAALARATNHQGEPS